MKKSFVALLVLLAVVVLVSPAIVGRLAEKSMDENLNWAADQSGEVKVTSQQFTRGWFSSEGQHRVELQEGDLLTMVQTLTDPMPVDELPVLIINTQLDHGLIPVSSMSREKGSLAPGLGSAVSTMAIELPDGESFDLPGKIYSKVGLGGELHSNYVLDAGSHSVEGMTANWGSTDIDIKTNPASGEAEFEGTVGSLSVEGDTETVTLGGLSFKGAQKPTQYGISVGNIDLDVDGLSVNIGGETAGGLKSMSVRANTAIDGDDVNADATMNVALHDLPQFGELSFDMILKLVGANAEAVGRMQQAIENMGGTQDPMAAYSVVEEDLKDLFASGFEMNFERFNVTLPQGTVTSKMLFSFREEDRAAFDWTSLLLNTQASIDLSVPEPLVEFMMQANPNVAMAIGGGYLVKRGDAYVMQAELKKGLLNVNGAPIPIPLGAVR